MRLGIDCRFYSSRSTGIGRYVFELVRHLSSTIKEPKYKQVELVLFFNEPEYSAFVVPHNRVHKVLADAKHYSWQEQLHFLKILNSQKLDLVHFTHFNAPIFYRRPSVVTIHDLTLSFFSGKKMTGFPYRLAYQLAMSSVAKKAQKIIAVSKHTKKDLIKLFKTPSEKVSVIYEGVDQQFEPLDSQTTSQILSSYNISKPYLLYTGVWRTHKNLHRLIKAFNLLKKDYAFDGKLVITGPQDPVYAPGIYDLVEQYGLTHDVVYTGLVDENVLIALYSDALVYVFPSLYEGFGLPPLEAMQCGTPVAASNTSCIPEICGEGNAVFFDPYDVEDMAEKIFRVIKDKDLGSQLVKNGFKHARKFSWDKMVQETIKIYGI